jgi:hypothetical protein
MDCQQARAQLALERLGRDAAPGSDALAAERHLSECDVCREAVTSDRQADSRITRAMLDVPVPVGFADRLHAAIGPALVVAKTPAIIPRRHLLRRLGWGSLTLVPMLAIGTLLVSQSVVLNDASIRELGKLDPSLLPVGSSPGIAVPAGWNTLRAIQFADAPRVATVNRVEIPLLMFTALGDRRSASCTGYLVRLPLSQWHKVPDADSFSRGIIQYAAFGTWVVWREGDNVIICVLQGDAHAMQRLQDLVAAGRQLT